MIELLHSQPYTLQLEGCSGLHGVNQVTEKQDNLYRQTKPDYKNPPKVTLLADIFLLEVFTHGIISSSSESE